MADAFAALRELLDAQDALKVEQRDIWSANRNQRLNDATTRASKADAAARRVIAGVAPTQAPSAPTRLMLEAGKGALWHASCREIEPTDDEIAAVWKAMEQARTDGVTASQEPKENSNA